MTLTADKENAFLTCCGPAGLTLTAREKKIYCCLLLLTLPTLCLGRELLTMTEEGQTPGNCAYMTFNPSFTGMTLLGVFDLNLRNHVYVSIQVLFCVLRHLVLYVNESKSGLKLWSISDIRDQVK